MIFFFQAEDGIRGLTVTGVQTCALPILLAGMMILASIIRKTGVFGWLAIRAARLSRGEPYRILVVLSLITDRKSTRLNSSHSQISYAVFCLKKKKKRKIRNISRTMKVII